MVSSMFYNVGNLQIVCQCDSLVRLVTREQHIASHQLFSSRKHRVFCRGLWRAEIAKYIFKIMGMQKWKRYL